MEHLEINLSEFGPNVKFADVSYQESPERVQQIGDTVTELTFDRHWVRCYFKDRSCEELERVVVISRFSIEVENSAQNRDILINALMELRSLEYHQAANAIAQQHGMSLLTGLNRKEVEETGSMLGKHNITYHILPTPVEFSDRLS